MFEITLRTLFQIGEKPSELKFLLKIQLEDSQPLLLEVNPDLTEWELKMKLEQELKQENFTIVVIGDHENYIIADECSQKFKGQTLKKLGISEKTILSIENDSKGKEEIIGASALEGGRNMRFPNFQEIVFVNYDPQAPEWQRPHKGINFVAQCNDCNQTVYIAKEIFDKIIYVESAMSDCSCPNPSCTSMKLKPKDVSNFLFLDCTYTITGKIKGNTVSTTKVGQASIDRAVTFSTGSSNNNLEENMVEWSKLQVKVKKDTPNNTQPIIISIIAVFSIAILIYGYGKYYKK